MSRGEWRARTKRDLMIEVWEHLDCETVGEQELEAIMEAVRERFSEVLEMDARWRTRDPYEPMFRNVLKFSDFAQAAGSIKRLDNLRRQFERKRDAEGLRRVRDTALMRPIDHGSAMPTSCPRARSSSTASAPMRSSTSRRPGSAARG